MAKKFKKTSILISDLEKYFSALLAGENAYKLSKHRKYASAALSYLDRGLIKVWDEKNQLVNAWVKKAILSYFQTIQSKPMNAGCFEYIDKLPVKSRTVLKGVRVVPGAIARFGSFIESGAILMPSFINVGAYVGAGTLVDTWATVGSCAHIGDGVHLSGGVGIGGVLEPPQAKPVVIESGAFIGSRAIIVEGVHVKAEAVIAAGVVLTESTKIIDVRGKDPKISQGVIPERAVVIPGSYPKNFSAGEYNVPCALIIGERKASTDLKTSLNAALREYSISV